MCDAVLHYSSGYIQNLAPLSATPPYMLNENPSKNIDVTKRVIVLFKLSIWSISYNFIIIFTLGTPT